MIQTKLYKKEYASKLIRGTDNKRPWDLQEKLFNLSGTDFVVLDIGSGTCEKLINFSKNVKKIFALEPSSDMREIAEGNISEHHIENIAIVDGVCHQLPFPNKKFDLATCMLAPWDVDELYRVLKIGGHVLIEAIGCLDKLNFKIEFGKDEKGWRGRFMEFEETEFIKRIGDDLQRKFGNIQIQSGFWDTYYSREGIIQLFEQTSTIRNFDRNKDISVIDSIESKYSTADGIKTIQNRLLINAVKVQ